MPLTLSVSNAGNGCGDIIIFMNSSLTRSAEIFLSRFLCLYRAVKVSFSIENSSSAERRTARSIRKASSENLSSGFPTALMIPCFKSFSPPKRSTISVAHSFPFFSERESAKSVDREIPARQIVVQFLTPLHIIRPAVVAISAFRSVRSDLNDL